MSKTRPWWRGAVVYQIYVRSFCDSNGDGVGDFTGVISKLDYLAALGIDALWLSPIHPSPNRDWGYDVSDYDDVHPEFGTKADFARLLTEAHARGLKVMTDEVLCHTSDEHAWFRDSVAGGGKADWYVWAPAKLDGTPPNNWLSAFAGEAWSYHPSRRAYYHHKFLRQQPKLNWLNPGARKAALAVLDHWLALGVDGFRLDVANAYLHDENLTNNPPVPMEARTAANWAHAPNLQLHLYDSNLVENLEALNDIRKTVERYPDRFVMGEFSEEPERCGAFASASEGLHSGYTFPWLLAHELEPGFIRDWYALLAKYPEHWPSIAFSNHDVIRTATRFGGPSAPPGIAQLMLTLLLTLKGTALLYQGEELGLAEAELRRDQLKDPVGDLYYPFSKGRDGCRTPMPWDDRRPQLGFTTGTPWLPVSPAHGVRAVSRQDRDPASTLACTRRLLALRKRSPALRWGSIAFRDAREPLLVFERKADGETVLCVFNLGATSAKYHDEDVRAAECLDVAIGHSTRSERELTLGPHSAWLGRF